MLIIASKLRLSLAGLLVWQAIAPFVHLSRHARDHHLCPVTRLVSSNGAAEFSAPPPTHHACTTCQWLSGNPGLTGALQVCDGVSRTHVPAALYQPSAIAFPAFDFNVAIARGPPAFSLAAV